MHILKNTQVIITAHESWKIFFLVSQLAMMKANNWILFKQTVKNTDTQETALTNNIFFKPACWILSRARKQSLWHRNGHHDRQHHNRTSDPQKSHRFQLTKTQLATLPIGHCPLRPGLGYILFPFSTVMRLWFGPRKYFLLYSKTTRLAVVSAHHSYLFNIHVDSKI